MTPGNVSTADGEMQFREELTVLRPFSEKGAQKPNSDDSSEDIKLDTFTKLGDPSREANVSDHPQQQREAAGSRSGTPSYSGRAGD